MSAQVDTEAARGMQHEAYLYRDDEDFVRGVGGFVREGLALGEAVVVAEPTNRLRMLRDALGSDGADVRFVDMTEAGVNPARIIPLWATFVAEYESAGRPMRGVGEPAWPGRRATELVECTLHELLLNVAFTDTAPWRLLCPYDAERLPSAVVSGALHTHPIWHDPADTYASAAYDERAVAAAFAEPLGPVPAGATRMAYEAVHVDELRRAVGDHAAAAGLPDSVVSDLVLAGHEIAANSVRYGGGSGLLSLWREPGAVVFQFDDKGHIADLLAGRKTPELSQEGGRGLFLVNQLCDLVQLRSSARGTTVRLTTWVS